MFFNFTMVGRFRSNFFVEPCTATAVSSVAVNASTSGKLKKDGQNHEESTAMITVYLTRITTSTSRLYLSARERASGVRCDAPAAGTPV